MWHWATRYFCAKALQKTGAKCHEPLQPKDKSWKSVKIQRQAFSASGFFFQLCPDLSITARHKVSVVEFTIYLLSKTEDHLFCHLEKDCKTLRTLIAGISQQLCRCRPFPGCFCSTSQRCIWETVAQPRQLQLSLLRSHGDFGWKRENWNSDLMR